MLNLGSSAVAFANESLIFYPQSRDLKTSNDNFDITDRHLRDEIPSLPKDELPQAAISPPLSVGIA